MWLYALGAERGGEPSSGLSASTLHPGFCVTAVWVVAPLGKGGILAGPLPATSMGAFQSPGQHQ